MMYITLELPDLKESHHKIPTDKHRQFPTVHHPTRSNACKFGRIYLYRDVYLFLLQHAGM